MMSGIFPLPTDGGLPPNPAQPNNPAQAFPPTVEPFDTSALYYGNGCDVRLRPHVLNSLISEIAATSDRAGFAYRASWLRNLETSVRYLIQQGKARAGLLVEQSPFYYSVVLDPAPTAYNDFMTLSLVPVMNAGETQNQGYVRISANGLPYVQLLRNDGWELRAADLRPGKPIIVVYYQGVFYFTGLANSQVPLVLVGGVDFWVRPDGHDDTGDGTANTPAKAFRTIDGCWAAVGSRYAASPTAMINIRLGVPGNYEGASLGPYGAAVQVIGDAANSGAYRILTKPQYTADQVVYAAYSMAVRGINNYHSIGVNFVMNYPGITPNGTECFRVGGSTATNESVQYTIEVDNPAGQVVIVEAGGIMGALDNNIVNGNGHTISAGFLLMQASQYLGTGPPWTSTWYWNNLTFIQAGLQIADRSAFGHTQTTTVLNGTHGKRYTVTGNSILYLGGQPIPGDTPGTYDTQGQVL